MSGKLVVKETFCAAALATADYPGFDGVTPLSGFLKKKSRGGSWQKRWFETRNHFLKYYKNNRHTGNPLAVVDLREADDVRIVQRFGQFDITGGDATFSLKAESLTQAKQWKTALEERMSVDPSVSDKDPMAVKAPVPAQRASSAPTAGADSTAPAPAAAAATAPQATDPTAKRLRTCGYLFKKGGQRHNWRRRFFVLTKRSVPACAPPPLLLAPLRGRGACAHPGRGPPAPPPASLSTRRTRATRSRRAPSASRAPASWSRRPDASTSTTLRCWRTRQRATACFPSVRRTAQSSASGWRPWSALGCGGWSPLPPRWQRSGRRPRGTRAPHAPFAAAPHAARRRRVAAARGRGGRGLPPPVRPCGQSLARGH